MQQIPNDARLARPFCSSIDEFMPGAIASRGPTAEVLEVRSDWTIPACDRLGEIVGHLMSPWPITAPG